MTIPPILPPSIPNTARAGDVTRPMFSALRIASSGLSAQRLRMDVVAQNLANAETTRTATGGPYRRRFVQLEAEAPNAAPNTVATAPTGPVPNAGALDSVGNDLGGVRVVGVAEDTSEGALVYDPGHPDADKSGYVRMPNVNMTDELMDLMGARRVYEANATVFEVAKAMLHRAIDI